MEKATSSNVPNYNYEEPHNWRLTEAEDYLPFCNYDPTIVEVTDQKELEKLKFDEETQLKAVQDIKPLMNITNGATVWVQEKEAFGTIKKIYKEEGKTTEYDVKIKDIEEPLRLSAEKLSLEYYLRVRIIADSGNMSANVLVTVDDTYKTLQQKMGQALGINAFSLLGYYNAQELPKEDKLSKAGIKADSQLVFIQGLGTPSRFQRFPSFNN